MPRRYSRSVDDTAMLVAAARLETDVKAREAVEAAILAEQRAMDRELAANDAEKKAQQRLESAVLAQEEADIRLSEANARINEAQKLEAKLDGVRVDLERRELRLAAAEDQFHRQQDAIIGDLLTQMKAKLDPVITSYRNSLKKIRIEDVEV